jgi:asparagine synthase (glutamine-hydrolysing)
MSGIAGILWSDKDAVVPGHIDLLLDGMAHRALDGSSIWTEPGAAMGYCALHTTPESLEEILPCVSADGSLVLTGDCRIDNREEVLSAMEQRSGEGIDLLDSQVVLAAYIRWGDRCVDRLLGDFAFAIWDRLRRRLFCARDHFGVRPFHYVHNRRFFAFASDEEALLRLPEVPQRVNEDRIAAILVPEFRDFDFNVGWFRDVLKLGAGQTMLVEADRVPVIHTYWRPEPLEESRFSSSNECEAAFREVFTKAVRCRMRTHGDSGAMLSGGIDSASVVAVARELVREMPGKEFHTFSTVSDDPRTCVETQNIERVLKGDHRYAHFVSVPSMRGAVSMDDLVDAAWKHAHPVANSILLPAMMYLAASRKGIRVVLDGIDGDLVLNTPPRYIARLLRDGQWRRAWSEARGSSANSPYESWRGPWRLFAENGLAAYTPGFLKRLRRRLSSRRVNGLLAASAVSLDFASRIRLKERLKQARADGGSVSPLNLQAMHARSLGSPGIVRGMEGFDRIAARYGIEARHPWSDKRLVDFCLRLPLDQMTRDGWTKYILRRSMAQYLPDEVRWNRTKEHLGWHMTYSLMCREDGAAPQTIKDALHSLAGFVDIPTGCGYIKNYRGLFDRYDPSASRAFYMLTLARWMAEQAG